MKACTPAWTPPVASRKASASGAIRPRASETMRKRRTGVKERAHSAREAGGGTTWGEGGAMAKNAAEIAYMLAEMPQSPTKPSLATKGPPSTGPTQATYRMMASRREKALPRPLIRVKSAMYAKAADKKTYGPPRSPVVTQAARDHCQLRRRCAASASSPMPMAWPNAGTAAQRRRPK
eukprot:scaffold9761_cov118-Isochrysis_galbana.AAC.7